MASSLHQLWDKGLSLTRFSLLVFALSSCKRVRSFTRDTGAVSRPIKIIRSLGSIWSCCRIEFRPPLGKWVCIFAPALFQTLTPLRCHFWRGPTKLTFGFLPFKFGKIRSILSFRLHWGNYARPVACPAPPPHMVCIVRRCVLLADPPMSSHPFLPPGPNLGAEWTGIFVLPC